MDEKKLLDMMLEKYMQLERFRDNIKMAEKDYFRLDDSSSKLTKNHIDPEYSTSLQIIEILR